MANTNTNTAAILSNLDPKFAADVLSTMSPADAAATLAAMNSTETVSAAPRRVKDKGKKSLRGAVTNDGTNRNASQFIRDCDTELSAKEVCEQAAELGLTFDVTYVYNIRAQAKKKAEEALNAEEAAKHAEEVLAKKRANMEKARAARAAKKAEAEAAAAAAAAKEAKKGGRKPKTTPATASAAE